MERSDSASTKRKIFNDSNLKDAAKESTAHKRTRRHTVKFRLKQTGHDASLMVPVAHRVPLVLTDLQHLLLHSLLGNLNLSEPPRWYVLEKCDKVRQTTCLILEGISVHTWETYKPQFEFATKCFRNVVEILTPSVYEGSIAQELALVPLSEVQKEQLIQQYGSMNLALEVRKDLLIMMKAVFPINDYSQKCSELTLVKDSFPRTQLILSAWQLIEEGYPVPLKGKLKDVYADYVMTKDEYYPVSEKSPIFGLDCEMCLTSAGSELTRVSIVNEQHEIVYESLVKPYNSITDYLTRYSGITKALLTDICKRIEDVQQDIRNLLPPDAILVGQSLNIDLHALKMMHPYVIDTSLIYNFVGERTRKPKLKVLAKEFLHEEIQSGKSGHCSSEDALACVKLVQLKLSKHLEYGDAVHTNRHKYKENVTKKLEEQYGSSIFNHMIEQKKSSVVIGCEDITGDYHSYLIQAKYSVSSQLKKGKPKKVKLITVDNAQEVISSITGAVTQNNFVMGHLKVNLTSENDENIVSLIDNWIKTIWDSMEQSSLFVVIFGGTCEDNGTALINVKN